MRLRRSPSLLLPYPVRKIPADIALVLFAVVLLNGVVFVDVEVIRIALGVLFVLFVPGYSFVSALFPERNRRSDERKRTAENKGDRGTPPFAFRSHVDEFERVVLSCGLSLILTPFIAMALGLSPWGITLESLTVSLSCFTLLTAGISLYRRWNLPEDSRYHPRARERVSTLLDELWNSDTTIELVVSAGLILSIVVGVGGVAYAFSSPQQVHEFSTVTLLSETNEGDYVADGYPRSATTGDTISFVLNIDNNENRDVNYTVVVVEQNVEVRESDVTVIAQNELQRDEYRLSHGEDGYFDQEIEPSTAGSHIRLFWLVYPDSAPPNPAPEDAPYAAQHWMNISSS